MKHFYHLAVLKKKELAVCFLYYFFFNVVRRESVGKTMGPGEYCHCRGNALTIRYPSASLS